MKKLLALTMLLIFGATINAEDTPKKSGTEWTLAAEMQY